jgi:hypothetical protein
MYVHFFRALQYRAGARSTAQHSVEHNAQGIQRTGVITLLTHSTAASCFFKAPLLLCTAHITVQQAGREYICMMAFNQGPRLEMGSCLDLFVCK